MGALKSALYFSPFTTIVQQIMPTLITSVQSTLFTTSACLPCFPAGLPLVCRWTWRSNGVRWSAATRRRRP